MGQQASQVLESAIVLAPENSLAEKYESSLEQALRVSLPELQALPKDKLLVVNVDVRSAVCIGLAVPDRLQPWRSRILDELPRFDVNAFDRLEQYAKALLYAQIEYTSARKRPADIRDLTEATRCRYQVLLNDARALASRGLIQPEQLAKFTGCRRRIDKVVALGALVNVLKTAWARIEGKTALTLTELEQADKQAVRLMLALAHQKKPLKDLAQIAELRQRAFTVFSDAYAQVRRAIRYLCKDEAQAERIIPSLYPRKRTARNAQSTAAAAAVTPATTAAGASSEPATEFASTPFEVINSQVAGTAPQQPSSGDARTQTAAKQRKSKRRRRPTKRNRFLRSLGITTRGHGSPHG